MDELADRSVVESSLRVKPAVFGRWFAASAAPAARRCLDREQVDLIVVDLDMEGGTEMVRAFRADARTSALPLMGMSYDADAKRVGRLLDDGLDSFLSKPLRRDVVRAEIEEIAGIRAGQSM